MDSSHAEMDWCNILILFIPLFISCIAATVLMFVGYFSGGASSVEVSGGAASAGRTMREGFLAAAWIGLCISWIVFPMGIVKSIRVLLGKTKGPEILGSPCYKCRRPGTTKKPGDGRCKNCDGDGVKQKEPCIICNKTGYCPDCNGTGWVLPLASSKTE